MKTVVLILIVAAAQLARPSPKVDIVSVAGCLKESAPNDWRVVNATHPAPSTANAPAPKDISATPAIGKNELQLIDVSVLSLPQHNDHAVLANGMPINAT